MPRAAQQSIGLGITSTIGHQETGYRVDNNGKNMHEERASKKVSENSTGKR